METKKEKTNESEKTYHDGDGNPCTLDHLCRKEPQWAASRIAHMREQLEERENTIHAQEKARQLLDAETDDLEKKIEDLEMMAIFRKVFYDLTVAQRDQAWRTLEKLEALGPGLTANEDRGFRLGVEAAARLFPSSPGSSSKILDLIKGKKES